MSDNHEKSFTYSGFLIVGIAYLLLLVILIICFVTVRFDTGLFIGLVCALTCICGLVALIVYLCSRHITTVNKKTKDKLEKGELKTPKRGKF